MAEIHCRIQANPIRYYMASLLPVVVIMALSAAVSVFLAQASSELGWTLVLYLVGGSLMGTMFACSIRSRQSWVELRGKQLDLPLGAFRRLVVQTNTVNLARTANRSWFQKLSGEQIVWLLTGERAILNHRWFGHGKLQALLQEVGNA